ncbi:DUF3084 domain-containing protein [Microcoleus sp. FACHB-53]|nr:DUF3084 domain-containing protein [Microcoleus sp. FACHB-53]
MTSGYILIVAILLLGGVIATLGDRIGTKVGKARLSLFNLRPRKTATLVTVITGSLISATTLGILFATSGSIRDGLLRLDEIKKNLRIARGEIQIINQQKQQVESELTQARTQQSQAQKRLDIINQNFQKAQTQLKNISGQATVLRSEIKSLLAERQQLLQQRDQLTEQITQLQTQVAQLRESVTQRDEELLKRGQTIEERNQELTRKNQTIKERNQELQEKARAITESEERLKELEQEFKQVIVQREARYKEREEKLRAAITQREARLQELEQELTQQENQLVGQEKQLGEREKQLAFLRQEVETLEQYYQNYQVLRQGNVALVRGQVLAFGVVRVVDPKAAPQAIEQLLREANRKAVEITHPNRTDADEPLVKIPKSQVESLINQIKDGKDYVVRILSVGNYVEGEKDIQVFADAVANQVVFPAGELLATISVDASTMTNEEIRQRLDQLLAAAQFRARRAGILGSIQIGDGRIITVINFIEQLEKYGQSVDIKAITQETTPTAGPLKLQLVAMHNGQVIFKT